MDSPKMTKVQPLTSSAWSTSSDGDLQLRKKALCDVTKGPDTRLWLVTTPPVFLVRAICPFVTSSNKAFLFVAFSANRGLNMFSALV